MQLKQTYGKKCKLCILVYMYSIYIYSYKNNTFSMFNGQ